MYDKENTEDDKCQRWRNGRESYRPAGELIQVEQDGYFAEVIPRSIAKEFVSEHHYQKSYPAQKLNVGLYRDGIKGTHELCGVATFSIPSNNKVFARYIDGGTIYNSSELGRFVLLDDVPGNGETWFLSRAFKQLKAKKPEIESILSFSDPVRRTSLCGKETMPGHIGTIYQAHNGRFVGMSNKKRLVLTDEGISVDPRMVSKLRNMESGNGYAREWIEKNTGKAMGENESPVDFVNRAKASLRTYRHPGNYAYLWPLFDNKKERREIERRFLPALNFPKQKLTAAQV